MLTAFENQFKTFASYNMSVTKILGWCTLRTTFLDTYVLKKFVGIKGTRKNAFC